jgi:hypothetical protein
MAATKEACMDPVKLRAELDLMKSTMSEPEFDRLIEKFDQHLFGQREKLQRQKEQHKRELADSHLNEVAQAAVFEVVIAQFYRQPEMVDPYLAVVRSFKKVG